jgi:CubicO group peptidase (beta-lactamase class C family)
MVYPERYPIQKAMAEAGVAPGPMLPTLAPDALMQRFGSLPLVHQPGEKWLYHSGSDILGVLIARVCGGTLEAFLRERIFEPLGMKDTAFSVPASKLDRLATCYRSDPASGRLVVFDEAHGGRFARAPVFESGGGGLVSTVDDYLAFGRMMLDKGKCGSERVLSRPSVELMTTDQITPEQKAASDFFPGFWDSRGWGFGLSRHAPRRPSRGPRALRLGWRLRHIVVRGPQGGDGGDPDDPAPLGFAARPRRAARFLDLGLPGDRRLTHWRRHASR